MEIFDWVLILIAIFGLILTGFAKKIYDSLMDAFAKEMLCKLGKYLVRKFCDGYNLKENLNNSSNITVESDGYKHKIIIENNATTDVLNQKVAQQESTEAQKGKEDYEAFEVSQEENLNAKQSYAEIEESAKQGDAEAQYEFGLLYYGGIGIEQNHEKAKEWIEKAANQELPKAQLGLGFLYQKGQGVAIDYKEAKKWYRKAAQQENRAAQQEKAEAQYNIGVLYHNALIGGKADHVKAEEWWKKASEGGHVKAQFWLGTLYYDGMVIKKDYLKAKECWEKAAKQGHADSQLCFAILYFNGQGVKQDYAKAKYWYEQAAEKGHPSAQKSLGSLYYGDYEGVKKDCSQAYVWLNIAGINGIEEAGQILESVTNELTPEERKKAEELKEKMIKENLELLRKNHN